MIILKHDCWSSSSFFALTRVFAYVWMWWSCRRACPAHYTYWRNRVVLVTSRSQRVLDEKAWQALLYLLLRKRVVIRSSAGISIQVAYSFFPVNWMPVIILKHSCLLLVVESLLAFDCEGYTANCPWVLWQSGFLFKPPLLKLDVWAQFGHAQLWRSGT